MKKYSFVLVACLATASATLFAGCTGANKENDVVYHVMTGEPPQLNGMKATDTQSFFVLGHVMEGLTRIGKDGVPAPGMAESWSITDKEATFSLRAGTTWSDGKPVTAKDFLYAWRTVVDPKTASEYAFILYYVKNAKAINEGKMPVDQLGVSAPDDGTLKVTFERPCAYFASLTGFPTYFPIREDFHKAHGEKYGADANDLIFNGPFMLTKWSHGASLRMDKNPNYWNARSIKVAAISIPYITPDTNAKFNFFKDHKVDLIEALDKDALPKALAEKFALKQHVDGSIWYLEPNFRKGHVTTNKNLRLAMKYAFNQQEFISKVIGIPGTLQLNGLIPSWLMGSKDKFRAEFPIAEQHQDLAKAKEYIEKAKKELGGSIPPLAWLTGDTPQAAKEAEYFQELYKRELGIDLRIDKQIFKQRLAKMLSGDFDIVSAGWGPDYMDPMTFADLWTSYNENNRGRWTNPAYDQVIAKALNTGDQTSRLKLMADAEKIGMEDLVVIPSYERTIMWMNSPRIKGVVRHQIGQDPDFLYTEVDNSQK